MSSTNILQFIDVEQNTERWFGLRKGMITASPAKAIMAGRGLAKGAEDLAMKIAYERDTQFEDERITTKDMERGHENEPVARALYEDVTQSQVLNGGFYCLGNLGVSPDGRLPLKGGRLGLIEIKCPTYKNHMRVLRSGTYDPQYYPQMQFQLYVTGADWVDFVSYCEDMPDGLKLHICRVYPDADYHKVMKGRLATMTDMIEDWARVLILAN